MSTIEQTRENRKRLEQEVAAIANSVFQNGVHVSIHWDLEHAATEHSGTYASISFHGISTTREEHRALEKHGLYFVEHASHVTKNPDMDKSIDTIDVDDIDDAAETDVELIVELSEQFIQQATSA